MISITRNNGMFKIYGIFNRLGQSCGLRAVNFSNNIVYLAKKVAYPSGLQIGGKFIRSKSCRLY
jgi:hypothetical protein